MDMDAETIRLRKWKVAVEGRLAALESRASPVVASPALSPSSSEVDALKTEFAGFAADLDNLEQALARVEQALADLRAANAPK